MESIEASAKTEEEAVAIALGKLNLERSQVEVVVLKRGRGGLFGFGSEEVRVRVTPIETSVASEVDVANMAKTVLENVLSLMGIQARVSILDKSVEEPGAVALDVQGEDLGMLIGRRGETLAALQYLVKHMVSRKIKTRAQVTVDVEGYRERRYTSLKALAHRLADQVKTSGRSATMEPMPANERRVVHLELADDPDVNTQSIGQDDERKITIVPRKPGEKKTGPTQ